MMEKRGVHCLVSGKVQGVWFRAGTQKIAKSLQLTGWVKNLPDGRVEVLAFGSAVSIQQLCEWLHEGPEFAHVTEVKIEAVPWQATERFFVM